MMDDKSTQEVSFLNRELLQEHLEALTLSDRYSGPCGLRDIANCAGLKNVKYAKKADVIEALLKYYSAPGILRKLWEQMPPGEQALVSLNYFTGGKADPEDIYEIARDYGLSRQPNRFYYYNGLRVYFADDSAFWLLCPGGTLPQAFFPEFDTLAKLPFLEYERANTEELLLIDRERRTGDFGKLLRYCNQNKCAVTKNGLMSKKSILDFIRFAGYEDLDDQLSRELDNVHSMMKLRVSLPLYLAAMSGGLLRLENGVVRPGSEAVRLMRLPSERQIAALFEAYVKNKDLKEIDYIPGIRLHRRMLNWSKARSIIIDRLRKYPAGTFWSVDSFSKILRITRRNLLRDGDIDIEFTGRKGAYCGWGFAERPFINFVFSVLGAMGILELGWEFWDEVQNYEEANNYEEAYYHKEMPGYSRPAAFRITELGAWVLGLQETYTPKQPEMPRPEGGFVVQPDFCVMVPESIDRVRHEIFFERFLTVQSTDPMMTVYRIDFDSMLRALEDSISFEQIKTYLTQGADKPVPDNVLRALDDWQFQSRRIKVRTVTLLETDDPVLLEEILHYKGMGQLAGERIQAAAVIEPENALKIKKLLEKNKRFCQNEF